MKQFLGVCEFICYCAFFALAVAYLFGVRPLSDKGGETRVYHFKGVFCGVELWEYSARGDAVTIWSDFVTNGDLSVHVVIRTNTYDEFRKLGKQ